MKYVAIKTYVSQTGYDVYSVLKEVLEINPDTTVEEVMAWATKTGFVSVEIVRREALR
jgi:hypothetical protein